MSQSLANDLAIAFDPPRLALRAGLNALDAWQADVLRGQYSRLLLNVHRQAGKSTIVALRALHQVLFQPSSLVLLFSPSLRQSRELFRKCIDQYQTIGRPIAPLVDNKLEIELQNRSRIVSLPGTEATTRGFSAPDLVIVDEAARVPAALIEAVLPMLAISEGSLVLLSTPYGRRGFFYDAWSGRGDWRKVKRVASECHRIAPSFLAEQKLLIDPLKFQQEYEGEFSNIAGQYFDEQTILTMFREGNPDTEDGDPYGSLDALFGKAATEPVVNPGAPGESMQAPMWSKL
ncbi:MAG TPA: terminase family protein [Blastocatellia bacterium]